VALSKGRGVAGLRGPPAAILSLYASTLLDAGARDARLEQLARLTASRYWRSTDEDWERRTTFLFRRAGRYLYAVFPIYRRRYFAAVRIDRSEVPADPTPVWSGLFEVVAVCVFEQDALQIAGRRAADEP
jgi:hypothetical protein